MKHFLTTWFIFFLFCLLLLPIGGVLLARALGGGITGLLALSAVAALIPAAVLWSAIRREERLKEMEDSLRDLEFRLERLREQTGN